MEQSVSYADGLLLLTDNLKLSVGKHLSKIRIIFYYSVKMKKTVRSDLFDIFKTDL